MKRYFAVLWIALRGEPGYEIVQTEHYQTVLERLAAFERRSQAGKRSHETRRAKAATETSGPVEGGTVVPLAGPQEISQ